MTRNNDEEQKLVKELKELKKEEEMIQEEFQKLDKITKVYLSLSIGLILI